MANSGGWASTQQREMSEFDSGENFSTEDGFNIGELCGLEGTNYDIVLCIHCSETLNC